MISLIVAYSKNRVIGIDNKLPWRLPNDLAYFKEKTLGKTIVMGRKTFESIGRALPDRRNIVLTTQDNWEHTGVKVIHSIEDILSSEEDIVVIGGSKVFDQTLPYADRLFVTYIAHRFEGDSYFPKFSQSEWMQIECEKGTKDKDNPYDYYFETYERK